MSNDESARREQAKTYHDCVEGIRTIIESMEESFRLGHTQLFLWEMEGAPVFMVVPDDPEAGRDASTRLWEILGES